MFARFDNPLLLPSPNIDSLVNRVGAPEGKHDPLAEQERHDEGKGENEAACAEAEPEKQSPEKHKLPRFWVE